MLIARRFPTRRPVSASRDSPRRQALVSCGSFSGPAGLVLSRSGLPSPIRSPGIFDGGTVAGMKGSFGGVRREIENPKQGAT